MKKKKIDYNFRVGSGIFLGLLFRQEGINFYKRLRKSNMFEKSRYLFFDKVLLIGTFLGISFSRYDGLNLIKLVAKNRKYRTKFNILVKSQNFLNYKKINLKSIVKNLGSKKRSKKSSHLNKIK